MLHYNMQRELHVNMHVMSYMVTSPLHVCGCGFHLRWSYDLHCTGVDVDANASREV